MSHLSSVQPPEVYEINGIKFMKILDRKEAIDELSVGQESLMSKRYQEDISNFEIIDTSPPSELPSSSYSFYINEARRAEEISFQPLYDFE
ncbi:unnamed protein product [Rhizophagus irregularis]|nr:unnamed protein product [Rhizophagus irregularis]